MKRIILFVLGGGCLAFSTARAQTFDLITDQLYEPLVGSPSVAGARSLSLGGAITASVQDGSALWCNPAALARIPRIEISGDLVHHRVRGESFPLTLDPLAAPPSVTSTDADLRRTRLGSAYLTVPVPTYRGALTIAAGFTLARNLDRALASDLSFAAGSFVDTLDGDPASFVAEEIRDYDFNEDQRGTVRAWQAGFGVDVSPRLSLGLAVSYYHGDLDFTNHTTFTGLRYEDTASATPGVPVRWDFVFANRETMSGWGAHGGLLYRPRNELAFGAVIRSPIRFTIDLDQLSTEQRDLGAVAELQSFTTRRLELPLAMQLGAAWLHRQWLFALDLAYTDWSQTEYKDSPLLTQYNDALSRAYREEFAVGGGVEWVIPKASTTLRAGLRWAQLPYAENYVVDERLTWSGGVGFLIDQTMALDLAVARETWRGGNPLFGFDERYGTTRVITTAAYRI
jgi:hypothetical protein